MNSESFKIRDFNCFIFLSYSFLKFCFIVFLISGDVDPDLTVFHFIVKKTNSPSTLPDEFLVLEFAFDSRDSSGPKDYLPYNYDKNCVVYTGTHDNPPIMGWWKIASQEEREFAASSFNCSVEEGEQWGIIRAIFSSEAELIIIPIQDFLGLGLEARINEPATLGNWQWRLKEGALTKKLAKRIKNITKLSKRLA